LRLHQLAQRVLARLLRDDRALAGLEVGADRRAQAVDGLGLAGVLGEVVVELGHVLGADLDDRRPSGSALRPLRLSSAWSAGISIVERVIGGGERQAGQRARSRAAARARRRRGRRRTAAG
jgi:hypothetical protein